MNNLKTIRERLGVTQRRLAEEIDCTQSNVSFYERGQALPSAVAKRVIEFAARMGQKVTYDDMYAEVIAITPPTPTPQEPAHA